MKIVGFISFMAISLLGAWPPDSIITVPRAPDVSSFVPGGLQQVTRKEKEEGCT